MQGKRKTFSRQVLKLVRRQQPKICMHENLVRAQIQDTGSATEIIRRTSHGWASEHPLARMVQSATKLRARSILSPVGEKKMKSYLVRVGHLCSPGIKRNLS